MKALLIYSLGAGLDIASTQYGLQNPNAVETNKWLQGNNLYLAKAAQVAALTTADHLLCKRGHKGWARAIRIGSLLIQAGVAYHNIQVSHWK